jgi:hypothetical protein
MFMYFICILILFKETKKLVNTLNISKLEVQTRYVVFCGATLLRSQTLRSLGKQKIMLL